MSDIQMFISGTQEEIPGHSYIYFVDYPFPVVAGGNMVIVRRKVTVDVAGEEIGPDSTQQEIESWAVKNSQRLQSAVFNLLQETKTNQHLQDVAEAWMEKYGKS